MARVCSCGLMVVGTVVSIRKIRRRDMESSNTRTVISTSAIGRAAYSTDLESLLHKMVVSMRVNGITENLLILSRRCPLILKRS